MADASHDLELILVREGDWRIAFDTRAVAKILVPTPEVTPDLRLATILGGTFPAAPLWHRSLILQAPDSPCVAVGTIVSVHKPRPGAVHVMPELLWNVGVPRWVVATYWFADGMYFVLDLLAAYKESVHERNAA